MGDTRIHPSDFPAVKNLILEIQALESRAHRLMMTATGQALNKAKNDAGWELAEQIERSSLTTGDAGTAGKRDA